MINQFGIKNLMICAALATVLTGCADRVSDAEAQMAEVRSGEGQPIEPLPQPEKVEDFVYSANQLRSPFLAPSLLTMQTQADQVEGVKPDVNRPRGVLEEYELSQLIYHGRVIAPNGQEYGLIQLPDGTIRDVKVGEYMGRSDGRVLEITPTQINLEEIVPDARSGFVYKRTPLVTPN